MARTRPSLLRARRPCSSAICRDLVARTPLVLASSSPQRRVLLARLGVPFTVRPSSADELERGEPSEVALENALRKARAVRHTDAHEAVLGCDTIVVLDGVIYGKPADEEQATATLRALAGRTHEVISAIALLLPGEQRTAVARTRVSFRKLDAAALERYVASGEWRGRSGGYAIQGEGAALAVAIDGEVENVVGLPLGVLLELYPELYHGQEA